ncbi:MAG: hypothetical protein QM640_00080, partial [Niabella sp.]
MPFIIKKILMDKNASRFRELFNRYLSGDISTEMEEAELWDYVHDPLYTWELENLLATAFENQPDEYTLTESRKREVLNRIFAARRAGLPERRLVRLWPRIAAGIAAVITIAVCSLYMLKDRSAGPVQQTPVPVAAADIAPGKVGATLTLADGKKISLRETANGTITKEGG